MNRGKNLLNKLANRVASEAYSIKQVRYHSECGYDPKMQKAFDKSTNCAEYVTLLQRPKTLTLPGKLQADSRIPDPPYHLIPEELKIAGLDYDSRADFYSNKYKDAKFQDKVPFVEFLLEQFLHRPRQLLAGSFSYTLPEVRKEYQFLAVSPNAARDLDLDMSVELDETNKTWFRELVAGQKIVPDVFPYSQAYAGWQFGQFAGQLGDGRVTNLFEIAGQDKLKTYEVQLKGSGKTPFSRFADGKAVLRSSIREFVISEYLNAIGIPTTRSLAITGLPKTYAQRGAAETCAVVARFAESWIRVGSFDLFKYRRDRIALRELADYCIEHVYKNKLPPFEELDSPTQYDRFYKEVTMRNARTTALTQVYGFLNGVLNTDNTSIVGLCIDFGPFAIMDQFDPNYTPNSEDHENRYGYDNVPSAIWWNLTRLGENLGELLGAGPELVDNVQFKQGKFLPEWEEIVSKRANRVIDLCASAYETEFLKTYVEVFCKRLGFASVKENDNDKIISPMLKMLWNTQINYNRFFVILNGLRFFDQKLTQPGQDPTMLVNYKDYALQFIPKGFENSKGLTHDELAEEIAHWLKIYHLRLIDENSLSDDERLARSKHYNPVFVPSNWIIEDVVDTLKDNRCSDISSLEVLIKMISQPFDKNAWGNTGKNLQNKWLDTEDSFDANKYMTQCSCSS